MVVTGRRGGREPTSGGEDAATARGAVRAPFGRSAVEHFRNGAMIDQFVEWFPGVERRQFESVLNHEVED